MKKVIGNKKPNNQIFYKFDNIEDFIKNIKEVQWNGECHYKLKGDTFEKTRDEQPKEVYSDLIIKTYEGWAEFDPTTHYLTNSDVSYYYPVSIEYFEANYEENNGISNQTK